ncbi:MAG: hypothetical protein KAT30_11855, partial [Candidatus Krumholzibacteria bacterium]|nr:hypothetical protein [Candidatus Krumholzibacteria bacterium]
MRRIGTVLGLMCFGILILNTGVALGQPAGAIVAWGYNADGQCDFPGPNGDFVAVAGGFSHSLGLKTDGTIVAWGREYEGQRNVPTPNADFVAVAGGWEHNLGIRRSPTSCAVPEIVSVDPVEVDLNNCSGGCAVSFYVGTQDDYSNVQKITLERKLPGLWVE